MFRIKAVEKMKKTHFMSSKYILLPPENRVIYEIICKNTLKPDGPQMTILLYGAEKM